MQRDATGKFIQNWSSETKQRVTVSLTGTAWQLLDEEARQQQTSRSELIEQFARSLLARRRAISSSGVNSGTVRAARSTQSTAGKPETLIAKLVSLRSIARIGVDEPARDTAELTAELMVAMPTAAVLTEQITEKIAELERANALLQQQVLEQQQTIEALQQNEQERIHHLAETAVAAANHRVVSILESITDAFIAFDHDWRYTYVNDEAEKLLRKSRSELLGKQVGTEVFLHAETSFLYQELQRAVAEQTAVEFESFSEAFNCWLEIRAYPGAEGLAIYFRDVTDRKQAEAALRQSEERLRLALDAGQMGAWEWNAKTNAQYWDAAQYQLFGIDKDTALDTNIFFNLVHPDDRSMVQQAMDSTFSASSCQAEFRIVRPDGSLRWIAGKGLLVRDGNGNPERIIGVNVDITERKAAEAERDRLFAAEQAAREQAVREAARSADANRIKDEFLAVLSHELRSPLNAMLGWLTLLRTRSFDAATTRRALETIERNARIQAQLVEDLLDVSRIIRGQMRLNPCPIALAPIITAALESVRPAAAAKNIALQVSLDPHCIPVLGDGDRLQQAVWNLLSNAIKFTPAGGQVEVRLEGALANGASLTGEAAQPVSVADRTSATAHYAQITVSDTGKGISPDFLPYVFDRFRQADSSITRAFGGLGLGLSIVRHLVELHGGTVQANSQGEGQGATFTIQLPLLLSTGSAPNSLQAARSPLSLAAEPLRGLRILAVDDETDARELLAQILQTAGATVTTAASAAAAIEILTHATPRYDLLISDIGMPQQNGYMLLQQVRELASPHQQVLALALTAYARDEDRQSALLAGFQSHLAKPVEPTALVAAIVDLVGFNSTAGTDS